MKTTLTPMHNSSLTIMIVAVATLLLACKPSVPRRYIQPDEMEDILYDWYMAQTMADDEDKGQDRDYAMHAYKLSVLKKHGVTEEQFDTALVYYTRHADKLHEMYRNIGEKLENEALALGADAREISRYGANVAEGDTADIWPGERGLVLSRRAPYNHVSYSVQGDTSLHKGDRVILSFDTRFIIQEGNRSGTAMLALIFDNDSVASRTTQLRKNGHNAIELTDNDSIGIKEVKGFVCIGDDNSGAETTLRMMVVENIRLVKMKRPAKKKANADDNTNGQAGKQNPDTARAENNDTTKYIKKKPKPSLK